MSREQRREMVELLICWLILDYKSSSRSSGGGCLAPVSVTVTSIIIILHIFNVEVIFIIIYVSILYPAVCVIVHLASSKWVVVFIIENCSWWCSNYLYVKSWQLKSFNTYILLCTSNRNLCICKLAKINAM